MVFIMVSNSSRWTGNCTVLGVSQLRWFVQGTCLGAGPHLGPTLALSAKNTKVVKQQRKMCVQARKMSAACSSRRRKIWGIPAPP